MDISQGKNCLVKLKTVRHKPRFLLECTLVNFVRQFSAHGSEYFISPNRNTFGPNVLSIRN